MPSELEKLLGDDTTDVTPPLEEKKPEKVLPPEESPEVKAKAEQLANLNKAIVQEQERLKKLRKERRESKPVEEDEEEELPKIDLNDPAAKAWDKRIREASDPARHELEKAKEERRIFALRQFLSDKPSLSKNPEKLKDMMETYDRLKTSSELTSEGITMDLEKAYAATHADELIDAIRNRRVAQAKNDAIFSDIAVSRGSTSYEEEKPKERIYTEEEKDILKQWERSGAPKLG